MQTDDKSNLPRQEKQIKTPSRRSRIGRDLTSEKTKLLHYMFDTLCSLRLTAKSYDYDFLSYLVEMAALEVQQEIKLSKLDSEHQPKAIDEQYPVTDTPLKAAR